MSFDSDFDYTGALSVINATISGMQSDSSNANAMISRYSSLAGFESLYNDKVTNLNNQVIGLQSTISKYNTVKSQILDLANIASPSKANVHTFWSEAVNEPLNRWKARLPENINGIIEQSDVYAQQSGGYTQQQKDDAGVLVCENFNYSGAIARLLKHF
jgi:hypothetical protein